MIRIPRWVPCRQPSRRQGGRRVDPPPRRFARTTVTHARTWRIVDSPIIRCKSFAATFFIGHQTHRRVKWPPPSPTLRPAGAVPSEPRRGRRREGRRDRRRRDGPAGGRLPRKDSGAGAWRGAVGQAVTRGRGRWAGPWPSGGPWPRGCLEPGPIDDILQG